MGSACEEHNIKLLTYGTLVSSPVETVPYVTASTLTNLPNKCGGFLADKWLGKPEPDIYDGSITPSQRKVK